MSKPPFFLFRWCCRSSPARTLIITTEDAPPHNMTKQGSDEITGLATELLKTALDETKIKYSITLHPWSRAYQMAQKDNDTCVYSTTRTGQREPLFKWIHQQEIGMTRARLEGPNAGLIKRRRKMGDVP